jgi:hypothetical protein
MKKTDKPAKTTSANKPEDATGHHKAHSATDITELMLAHHEPLKRLIKTMKSEEASLTEVRQAYKKFAPLLEAHAIPEQESLYVQMKEKSKEMRVEGFEGDTEHAMADLLTKEINRTSDDDAFRAKVKVLAESVEHHIEEEEDDMIPEIRKSFSAAELKQMGALYLSFRARFEMEKKAA